MAEVVGLVASIVQIAGAGAKLSTALYHFTTSAVRADQDITDIAEDVVLTSNALESVGKVFETEDANSIVSKKAIQDANNIIKRCEAVFSDISELVEKRRTTTKNGKKGLSMMGKLSWPLKEQRVELHRRRLDSLKHSLILLLHVLQFAQGNARGQSEKASLEQEREKIRELHQRQQDSLKCLQALETKLSKFALDDDKTLQGSSTPSRVPTLELMFGAQSAKAQTKDSTEAPTSNSPSTTDAAATEDSETNKSDATLTDDNDEHLSLEELAKAAEHVQKLLKRITTLQKTYNSDQKSKIHNKRRVHKIYQRFCRKWESNIVIESTKPPVDTGRTQDSSMPGIRVEHDLHSKMPPSQYYSQLDLDKFHSNSQAGAIRRPASTDLKLQPPIPQYQRMLSTSLSHSAPPDMSYPPPPSSIIDASLATNANEYPKSQSKLPAGYHYNLPQLQHAQTFHHHSHLRPHHPQMLQRFGLGPNPMAPNSTTEGMDVSNSYQRPAIDKTENTKLVSEHVVNDVSNGDPPTSTRSISTVNSDNGRSRTGTQPNPFPFNSGSPIEPSSFCDADPPEDSSVTHIDSSNDHFIIKPAYELHIRTEGQALNPMLANWKDMNMEGSNFEAYSEQLQSSPVDFAINASGAAAFNSMAPFPMADFQQESPNTTSAPNSYEQWMEIRALSGNDSVWADIPNFNELSDNSAIVFDPARITQSCSPGMQQSMSQATVSRASLPTQTDDRTESNRHVLPPLPPPHQSQATRADPRPLRQAHTSGGHRAPMQNLSPLYGLPPAPGPPRYWHHSDVQDQPAPCPQTPPHLGGLQTPRADMQSLPQPYGLPPLHGPPGPPPQDSHSAMQDQQPPRPQPPPFLGGQQMPRAEFNFDMLANRQMEALRKQDERSAPQAPVPKHSTMSFEAPEVGNATDRSHIQHHTAYPLKILSALGPEPLEEKSNVSSSGSPYGASTDRLFSHQYTRQLSTSPPPVFVPPYSAYMAPEAVAVSEVGDLATEKERIFPEMPPEGMTFGRLQPTPSIHENEPGSATPQTETPGQTQWSSGYPTTRRQGPPSASIYHSGLPSIHQQMSTTQPMAAVPESISNASNHGRFSQKDPPSTRAGDDPRRLIGPDHRAMPPPPSTALILHSRSSSANIRSDPRAREPPPPHLPPPRHVADPWTFQDPGWTWDNINSPKDTGFSGNQLARVRPGHHLALPQPSVDQVLKEREVSVSKSFGNMNSENNKEKTSDDVYGPDPDLNLRLLGVKSGPRTDAPSTPTISDIPVSWQMEELRRQDKPIAPQVQQERITDLKHSIMILEIPEAEHDTDSGGKPPSESDPETVSEQPRGLPHADVLNPVNKPDKNVLWAGSRDYDDRPAKVASRSTARLKSLVIEQRKKAALMRIVGACDNCKRRKEKCDQNTPCRPCVEHYKDDLVHHPCRSHRSGYNSMPLALSFLMSKGNTLFEQTASGGAQYDENIITPEGIPTTKQRHDLGSDGVFSYQHSSDHLLPVPVASTWPHSQSPTYSTSSGYASPKPNAHRPYSSMSTNHIIGDYAQPGVSAVGWFDQSLASPPERRRGDPKDDPWPWLGPNLQDAKSAARSASVTDRDDHDPSWGERSREDTTGDVVDATSADNAPRAPAMLPNKCVVGLNLTPEEIAKKMEREQAQMRAQLIDGKHDSFISGNNPISHTDVSRPQQGQRKSSLMSILHDPPQDSPFIEKRKGEQFQESTARHPDGPPALVYYNWNPGGSLSRSHGSAASVADVRNRGDGPRLPKLPRTSDLSQRCGRVKKRRPSPPAPHDDMQSRPRKRGRPPKLVPDMSSTFFAPPQMHSFPSEDASDSWAVMRGEQRMQIGKDSFTEQVSSPDDKEQERTPRQKKKRWTRGVSKRRRSESMEGDGEYSDDDTLDDVDPSARRLRRRVRGPANVPERTQEQEQDQTQYQSGLEEPESDVEAVTGLSALRMANESKRNHKSDSGKRGRSGSESDVEAATGLIPLRMAPGDVRRNMSVNNFDTMSGGKGRTIKRRRRNVGGQDNISSLPPKPPSREAINLHRTYPLPLPVYEPDVAGCFPSCALDSDNDSAYTAPSVIYGPEEMRGRKDSEANDDEQTRKYVPQKKGWVAGMSGFRRSESIEGDGEYSIPPRPPSRDASLQYSAGYSRIGKARKSRRVSRSSSSSSDCGGSGGGHVPKVRRGIRAEVSTRKVRDGDERDIVDILLAEWTISGAVH